MGLTIFAFGTSAPELFTNVFASIGCHEEIVFGNIIGSNIFNLLFILGICAIASPLTVRTVMVRRQVPLSLGATLVLAILINDVAMFGGKTDSLSRFDGGLLLFGGLQVFLFYMLYIFAIRRASSRDSFSSRLPDLFTPREESDDDPDDDDDVPDIRIYSGFLSFFMTASGLVAIICGGWLVVKQCAALAEMLAVHQRALSLTIMAIGTSLPELIVSWRAIKMNKSDLAIANVIGSNIFNIVGIMGVSGLIRSAPFHRPFNQDILLLAGATLAFHLFTQRKRAFGRTHGIVFVSVYSAYLAYLIWRH
jgi:cation:H+ antiporter